MNPEQAPQGELPAELQTGQPLTQQSTPQAPIQPQMNQHMQPAQMNKDAGYGLGIASLVTSVIGLGLVGIILGIVGLRKSKKSGHNNVMAIIGIVLGALSSLIFVPILAGLVLNNFSSVQGKARDTQRFSRINAIHSRLEVYYNEKDSYPLSMDLANFPGIDSTSTTDPRGGIIKVSIFKNLQEATSYTKPASANHEFQYNPFGCDKVGCKGYILRSYIEHPTSTTPNPYVKNGLQNP